MVVRHRLTWPSIRRPSIGFFHPTRSRPGVSRRKAAMPSHYPPDRSACMRKDGPSDQRYRIAGGKLLYSQHRDVRFPHLYELPTHALVHSRDFIKNILVHVVDTTVDARVIRAEFVDSLSVPLGPNELMETYGILFAVNPCVSTANKSTIPGLFELKPGTVVFAWPLRDDGVYREEDDIVEGWCLDG